MSQNRFRCQISVGKDLNYRKMIQNRFRCQIDKLESMVDRFGCLNFQMLRVEKDSDSLGENLRLKHEGFLRSNPLSIRRYLRLSNDASTNCGEQVGFHEEVFQMLAF